MCKRYVRWLGLGLIMAISFVLLSGSSEVSENAKYITTTHTDSCGNTVTDTIYVPDDTPTPEPTPTPTTGTGSCSPGKTLFQDGQVVTGVTQLTHDQVYPPQPTPVSSGCGPSSLCSTSYWCPSLGDCVSSCSSCP